MFERAGLEVDASQLWKRFDPGQPVMKRRMEEWVLVLETLLAVVVASAAAAAAPLLPGVVVVAARVADVVAPTNLGDS